jgi:hypothetical protein
MVKNPDLDMIFLHDCPETCKDDDIRKLESDIKWHLQQDSKDLCVKFYFIPKHSRGLGLSFIVIFLGGCKKIGEIVTLLTSKSWTIGGYETKLKNRTNQRREI